MRFFNWLAENAEISLPRWVIFVVYVSLVKSAIEFATDYGRMKGWW